MNWALSGYKTWRDDGNFLRGGNYDFVYKSLFNQRLANITDSNEEVQGLKTQREKYQQGEVFDLFLLADELIPKDADKDFRNLKLETLFKYMIVDFYNQGDESRQALNYPDYFMKAFDEMLVDIEAEKTRFNIPEISQDNLEIYAAKLSNKLVVELAEKVLEGREYGLDISAMRRNIPVRDHQESIHNKSEDLDWDDF
ncbi:MAG: hypothetical protein HRT47_02800 [Candidatus Caenarcaniphilales bacterium]|nr:hypothetical protein [Candidatus Caenarcaniphilales bacterium]